MENNISAIVSVFIRIVYSNACTAKKKNWVLTSVGCLYLFIFTKNWGWIQSKQQHCNSQTMSHEEMKVHSSNLLNKLDHWQFCTCCNHQTHQLQKPLTHSPAKNVYRVIMSLSLSTLLLKRLNVQITRVLQMVLAIFTNDAISDPLEPINGGQGLMCSELEDVFCVYHMHKTHFVFACVNRDMWKSRSFYNEMWWLICMNGCVYWRQKIMHALYLKNK